jgi:hypothetical protein
MASERKIETANLVADVLILLGPSVGDALLMTAWPLFASIGGAFSGWIVAWMFGEHIPELLGLDNTQTWHIGLLFGFVGGFIRCFVRGTVRPH